MEAGRAAEPHLPPPYPPSPPFPRPHLTPTLWSRTTAPEGSGPDDLIGFYSHTCQPSAPWWAKVRTAESAVTSPISPAPEPSSQSLGIRVSLLNVSDQVLSSLHWDTLNNGFCLDYSSKPPEQPGPISSIPTEPRAGGPIPAIGVSIPGPPSLLMGQKVPYSLLATDCVEHFP